MGWRLGGKGASGRNGEPGYGHRIEEHGFHVWMGFYDNAFKMMKDTYAELARTTGPFRTWTDAFKKHSHVVIEELDQGQRKRWQVEFPTGFREPGTFVRLGLLGYAGRMFKLLYKRLPDAPPHQQAVVAPLVRIWQRIWRTAFIALLLALALAEYFLRLGEHWVKRHLAGSRIPGVRAVLNPLEDCSPGSCGRCAPLSKPALKFVIVGPPPRTSRTRTMRGGCGSSSTFH